jgi:preprotein translocase subunit YajC
MGSLHLLAAAATTTSKTSSSSYLPLLIIVALFGVMYFFLIRPQRNKQRQAMQTQRQVGDGARIRTTAGIYGTIVEGDDDNVIVEIAPNVRIKMMRRAIMNVVSDDEPDGVRQTVPDLGPDAESASADDRTA